MSAKTIGQRRKSAEKSWQKLQDPARPVIYVGAGSCGRAAGATEVIEAVKAHHWDGSESGREGLNIISKG